MNRGTWKKSEREWADMLGGVRVPVTGRQRGAAPDVAHDIYAIEVKKVGHGKVNPYLPVKLRDAIDQAQKSAAYQYEQDGKARTPLVGIEYTNESRRVERYVVLSLADFLELTSLEEDR